MAEAEKVILTNLCMVYDGAGNILVLDRKKPDWPGLCFPGGHVEPGESFVEAVIREVREETGLNIECPRLCGIKQFPTDTGERYMVLLYKANRFEGTLQSSQEGEVFWIPENALDQYTLASDFEAMLRLFREDSLSEFFYYYQESDSRWHFKLL